MNKEVWVLGATGRTGRAVATRLHEGGVPLVLVGRNRERLEGVCAGLGGAPRLLAGELDSALAELARDAPAVVVNTVGPFATIAPEVVRACPPGTHYVDLANDVTAVSGLLGLHEEAVAAGRSLVTGAGFGVLATESVVAKLCLDRPAPDRVRVDALGSVETEAGMIGEALAATIVDGLPDGGRRYENGRLVRTRLAGDLRHLTLPDGSGAAAASVPSGELTVARRASGAPFVVAASSEVPSARIIRALLPLATALLSIKPLRTIARRRLASEPRPANAPESTPGDTHASDGRTGPPGKDGSDPATPWTSPPRSRPKSRNDWAGAKAGRDRTPPAPSSGPSWPRRSAASS